MATNEKRTSTIILDGKQPAKTIKDLAADIRILQNHLKKLDKDSDAFKSGAKKMRELRNELGQANQQMRNVNTGWSRFWQIAKSTAAGVFLGNILTNLASIVTSAIPKLIQKNAELSDSYADIRKTTGLTNEQVKELDKTLSTFNTRTSKKELRELAVEAGRLGIEGVKNIAGFVKAADQIRVALGDDLGGNASENIRIVGKLTEQFRVGAREGVNFETAMLKTGSAINELSASGSAQAEFLVNFTRRVSGVATQADISIDKILAFAATLDEAGQNVEVSGTTISKVITQMFTDTDTFANIAGVSTQEFAQILKEDAAGALQLFLKGLNGNNAGLQELALKLEDADLSGARATAVLASLANNTDKLSEKLEISSKALKEGTSLTDEFNVKNNNLAGTLDKIQKKLAALWLNSTLRNAVTEAVELFGDLLGINEKLSTQLERERGELRLTESRILQLNIGNEDRVKLIKELQSQYPDYLSNLDAEKVTNEELSASIAKVNQQMINKIILAKQDEKIAPIAEKKGDLLRRQIELETELQKSILQVEEKYKLNLDKTQSALGQYQQIRDLLEELQDPNAEGILFESGSQTADQLYKVIAALERLKQKEDELFQEKLELQKRLGISTEAPAGNNSPGQQDRPTASVTVGPSQDDLEKQQQALEKAEAEYAKFLDTINKMADDVFFKSLGADEREIAQVNAKYDAQQEKLMEYLAAKTITEEEYFQTSQEIERQRLEEILLLEDEKNTALELKKKDFQDQLDELSRSNRDSEIAATNAKYDELLRLAEIYGIDTAQIEELRRNELVAIDDYYNNIEYEKQIEHNARMLAIRRDFANALFDLLNGLGQEQSAFAEFARGLAFFQLAVSQANALGNALETSTAPTPDNVASGGLAGLAKFIAISTAILRTVNGARALVNGEQIPTYSTSTTFAKGGFISYGPMHSEGGMPIVNPITGQKQGELQGGEAILSRETVMNNFGVVRQLLEQSLTGNGSRIPSFNYGGIVDSLERSPQYTSTTTLDASAFDSVVKQFAAATRSLKAEIVMDRNLIRAIRDNIQEIDSLDGQSY